MVPAPRRSYVFHLYRQEALQSRVLKALNIPLGRPEMLCIERLYVGCCDDIS